MYQPFADRHHAGVELARQLAKYAARPDVTVLGLVPGGVPVAWEVARSLRAPVDVLVVKPVGAPKQPDLVIGAVAWGDVSVITNRIVTALSLSQPAVDAAVHRALPELRRTEAAYREHRAALPLASRTVIVVDDGLAPRVVARAAVHAVRQEQPARVVVAAPVAALDTCTMLGKLADEVVCPWTPESLADVAFWYRRLSRTTDDEIRALLRRSRPAHLQHESHAPRLWDA